MVGSPEQSWTASKKKDHMEVKIRDQEADIDVSFFGAEANAFCGEIGSSLSYFIQQ